MADAVMSSILNKDFISVRLIVQGMSLGEDGRKPKDLYNVCMFDSM